MTRLFRSKSSVLDGPPDPIPPVPTRNDAGEEDDEEEQEEEEEEEEEEELESEVEESFYSNPISTPFISPRPGHRSGGGGQSAILDMLAAALRKSLVTCSVEMDDVASSGADEAVTTTSGGMDIGWPTNVRHVSHVTFDRFNGFLGLPSELQPEVPRRVPSASAKVFGVSAKSMQCSYDDRGNSVPTILLMMQRRLYVEGGLKAEGIFRINAENGQEEFVRDQLNNGIVPRGIDVHCLAGLIKAWFRELPSGILDSLSPDEVMRCSSEDDRTQLVMLLPSTEAALLNWAINLMADVAEHEQYNKMNARNIAMVFAPNMTQMADPLTALIHAVQVMNLLKALILKTLRERDGSTSTSGLVNSVSDCPINNAELCQSNPMTSESCENTENPCKPDISVASKFLRSTTMNRLEYSSEEYWNFPGRITREEKSLSLPSSSRLSLFKSGPLERRCKDGSENGERLSFREGVKRLCRHPVFQLSKPGKKTRGLGIVNTY